MQYMKHWSGNIDLYELLHVNCIILTYEIQDRILYKNVFNVDNFSAITKWLLCDFYFEDLHFPIIFLLWHSVPF